MTRYSREARPTRRVLRRLSLPAAILTAALAILLPSADAHGWSNDGRCESGEVCLFDHAGFSGAVLFDRTRAHLEYWGGAPVDGWAVNRASSVANRTPRYFCLYAYEFGRASWVVQPWEWVNIRHEWNDRVDGVKVC